LRTLDRYIQKLATQKQSLYEFRAKLKQVKELEYFDIDDIENLRLLGLPVVELEHKNIALETTFTPVEKQKFCIVDIETTSSKIETGQIIEIGAITIQNGKILDRFESFAKCDCVPENITYLTGIKSEDVKNAPSLKSVLEKFRLFLSDCVFVAHNVNFDYYFISDSLQNAGFGPLLNRRICSIDLARKTFEAPKYGLGFLIEFLEIETGPHHRAYSDALATVKVLEKSFESLPENVITTEDLLKFAKPNPKPRKKKKESL
jgi:DNA polymerase-3 subunit epsilon